MTILESIKSILKLKEGVQSVFLVSESLYFLFLYNNHTIHRFLIDEHIHLTWGFLKTLFLPTVVGYRAMSEKLRGENIECILQSKAFGHQKLPTSLWRRTFSLIIVRSLNRIVGHRLLMPALLPHAVAVESSRKVADVAAVLCKCLPNFLSYWERHLFQWNFQLCFSGLSL